MLHLATSLVNYDVSTADVCVMENSRAQRQNEASYGERLQRCKYLGLAKLIYQVKWMFFGEYFVSC